MFECFLKILKVLLFLGYLAMPLCPPLFKKYFEISDGWRTPEVRMAQLKLISRFVVSLVLLSSCSPPEFNSTTRGPSTLKPKSAGEQVGASGDSAQANSNSNGKTSSAGEGTVGLPKEVADCANKNLQAKEFVLDFPATKGQCKWDIGEDGGKMMGHLEQTLKLPIESNWVLCSVSIFSNKSDFYYDDYIMMHFDDRVLIGSTGVIDFLDSDENGLPIFNWSKLQRQRPGGTKTCLPGASKCSMPGTQQNGTLALELEPTTNLKLVAHAFKSGRYDFQMVMTGDNDPSIDCAHNGIAVNVGVKYYVK
jgi:hypothetical protein